MSTFASMKTVRRWLLASREKVPHYLDGTKRHGRLDSAEDVARLATYAEAEAALAKCSPGWHLGFALGPDGEGGNWQGIDFDAVEDNLLAFLVDDLPGYVETSPSGAGLHAIGYGRAFRPLGSNGSGIEAYAAGRFFTVTGNAIRDGALVCLADHVESVLARSHKSTSTVALSSRSSETSAVAAPVHVSAQVVADLRSALNYLRSDNYALWIEVGHALKVLGDVGRGLWLDWSSAFFKFDSSEAAQKWESFDPQSTGYQAVFAKAQTEGWVNPASNAAMRARTGWEALSMDAPTITAMPFSAPETFDVPPRPWVLGNWLLRGTVTTVIAPGGTGKSALMVAFALSLSTGINFLGKAVWGRAQRVWLWNLEDDRNELTRQLVASSLHHGIGESDYQRRLYVNDASNHLCMATKGRDGLVVHEPVVSAVIAEIRAKGVDVLIIDPFVSSHRAEENDNGQIDAIVKTWTAIARETHCSIVLVHHSRKLGGQQVDAEAARGASALGNAARSVLVLNRMEKGEASRFGISEDDRRSYVRVSNDKSNRAPAGAADWFRLVPVTLANGGPAGGDSVAVIERWMPPDVTTVAQDFDDAVRSKAQAAIAAGDYRAQPSAKNWAGHAIAFAIGLVISNPVERHRVKALIADMLIQGQLRVENRPDASRHLKDFIVVGDPIDADRGSHAWGRTLPCRTIANPTCGIAAPASPL